MANSLTNQRGISLVELIIVMTILLFLIAAGFWAIRSQMAKGNDAKRKDDLERIRVAFEDYYNDHGCYPDVALLRNCGSDSLAPYLDKIPCDPATGEPYLGVAGVLYQGGCATWYKVYTRLENENDPAIAKLGIAKGTTINEQEVNYGVASPNVAVGNVPPTTFICSSGEIASSVANDCANPENYLGQCGIGACGCQSKERIEGGTTGYYCCYDPTCP